MTPKQILAAIDFVDDVAKQLQSGAVATSVSRSTRSFIALKRANPFILVMRVLIGPRGGVVGYVYLRNCEICPAVDSIRIGEIPDFSNNEILPLGEIFWPDDRKSIPDESAITDFLLQKVERLPSEEAFYIELFDQGRFDTPADSIRALLGGATGLGK